MQRFHGISTLALTLIATILMLGMSCGVAKAQSPALLVHPSLTFIESARPPASDASVDSEAGTAPKVQCGIEDGPL